MALAGVHFGLVGPGQDRLAGLEANLAKARQGLAYRQEAKQARQDLVRVLAFLPEGRDFARLPLVISGIAQRDRVAIPSFTYTVEKPEDAPATKAILQGAVTGQYEDLRRFIHDLEASERVLLFIEDLSVGQSSDLKMEQKSKKVTVNLRLATYIREEAKPARGLKASLE
jgi:Tfp pilus assembly protein PilO